MARQFFIAVITLVLFNGCNGHLKKPGNFIVAHSDGVNVSSPHDETLKIIRRSDTKPDEQIHCSLQDKAGNMWFATSGDGVYRYDGKSFVHFTKKDGLSHNQVLTMKMDHVGNIWFGTMDGACSFDGRMFSSLSLPETHTDGASPGLGNSLGFSRRPVTVASILEDRQGVLWFGTSDGLYRYDAMVREGCCARNAPRLLSQYLKNEQSACCNPGIIRVIYEDHQGNIWISTGSGGSIYRIAYEQRNHPCLTHTCTHGALIHTGWSAHEKALGEIFSKVKGVEGKGIYFHCALEDRSGRLWFGTLEHGIYSYDESSGQMEPFRIKDGPRNSRIVSMLEDRTGNIRMAAHGTEQGNGLYCYDALNGKFKPVSAEDLQCVYRVTGIAEDKTGKLWFGSEGNCIFSFSPADTRFTTFQKQDGFTHANVTNISEDREGNLWFGTLNLGLSRYQASSGKFEDFTAQTLMY